MTTYSPYAGLPRPDLADPPNGPTAIANLANALDFITIPKFSSVAARNSAIPSPTGGQHAWLTDSNTLTVYNAGTGSWNVYGANAVSGGRAIGNTYHGELAGGIMTLSTTVADVPGTNMTVVTTKGTALALIMFTGDFLTTASGAGTGVLSCYVDNVEQGAQVNYSGSNTTGGARGTGSQTLLVPLSTAGSHNIKLRSYLIAPAGIRLNGPHTSLTVIIFE